MKKKSRKRKHLWHPVYRFGRDVKAILKRAKASLSRAEERIGEDLRKKRKGKAGT